jgi:ubiquinone/menaquinone biosynthesis C-methylase UbiE
MEYEEFYRNGGDLGRLTVGRGRLEFARCKSIISRKLVLNEQDICDVGCGSGAYSVWLSGVGCKIHLLDPVPENLNFSLSTLYERALGYVSAAIGCATELPYQDCSMDVVLIMGPLYHLLQTSEREKALSECFRVLRPGGTIIATAISRHYWFLTGMKKNFLLDSGFQKNAINALAEGEYFNFSDNLEYFVSCKCHSSEEIKLEICNSGFRNIQVYGVEGASWLSPLLGEVSDHAGIMEKLVQWAEVSDSDPIMKEMSAHFLAFGSKT